MSKEIATPMAGKVVSILVNEGDTIQEDDEILLLEAMKMETTVYATDGGKVKKINIKSGDRIEEDDIVMILE